MTLTLTSDAFSRGDTIPRRYTADGDDVSPPLAWSGAPQGTRSFALVVDDPDAPDPRAPRRTWVHWVLFNVPPDVAALPEDADRGNLPASARAGKNDWGKRAYGGPAPPAGRHRYVHKIYALDTVLDLRAPTKGELEAAMVGHVLDHAELIGTYERGRLGH